MDVTVVVGTFGDLCWRRLAQERAIPSAEPQAPVIHVHGVTLAQARNRGVALARTEWIAVLDADDALAPDYMERMAEVEGDLRGPAVDYVADDGSVERVLWPRRPLREGNYLPIGTLVRRDLFRAVGGFLEWPVYEDWCLWQRCALAGASIAQVPDAVYRAHVSEQGRNTALSEAERRRWREAILRHNYAVAAA